MTTFGRLLLKRMLVIPISLFLLVTLAFGLVQFMPGDPAVVIAGPFAADERVAEIRSQLHLDRPLLEQYGRYISGLAKGDLGRSFVTREAVLSDIASFLPNSVELIVLALIFAVLVGLALGTMAAYFRDRLPDGIARLVISIFQAVPDFLLGLLLIYVFFFLMGIAPSPVGRLSLGEASAERLTRFLLIDTILHRQWDLLWSALRHLFLPVLTLGIVYAAYFAKITRATMAKELVSQHIDFARACGLPERQVLRYAFVAARTPIMTYGAILFGTLIGGQAIVESIFAWQGLGQWALQGILQRDVPVIQGFVLVSGVATLTVYLLLDILVMRLDPRVSYARQ